MNLRSLVAAFLTAIPALVLDGALAAPAPWQPAGAEPETTDEAGLTQKQSRWLQAMYFHLGGIEFRHDADESNRHPLFGISTDLGRPDWPVAFAADFLAAYGKTSLQAWSNVYGPSETHGDLTLLQLRLGVRKTWHHWPIRPFVGGGAALLKADARRVLQPSGFSEVQDSQVNVRPWLSAGAVVPLRGHLSLGLEATVMKTSFDFKSSHHVQRIRYETEARPLSVTAFLGWQARPSLEKPAGQRAASGDDFEENAWANSLNVTIGPRSLGNEVQPVEMPLQIMLATDLRKARWPVALALDASFFQGKKSGSINDFFFEQTELYRPNVDLEMQGGDVDVGVRWTRRKGSFRPVLGAGVGVTVVSARAIERRFGRSVEGLQDTTSGENTWFQAGGYWPLGPSFHMGFDLRYSSVKVVFERNEFEQEVTLDGLSAGILIGWR